MFNIWMLAGGSLAAAAIAIAARLLRNRGSSPTTVQPVSEEWLSHARAGKEHEW